MRDEIEATLRRIGGDKLVENWRGLDATTIAPALPSASLDTLSLGYAMALGSMAAVIDASLDAAFRAEMADRHRYDLGREAELKVKVNERLKDLGVYPDGKQPKMAMDWYQSLNEDLGLHSPYRLRPSNHRIVNHTDRRTVIEMLVRGEAGFGDLRYKLYPGMSETAARELYELHIAADRCTAASLPLRSMAWMWEQSVKTGNPVLLGAPNKLFTMLSRLTPNVDWSSWFNAFFKAKLIPEGASLGDAMIKLYDTGKVNQRIFWTGDKGAAVGGAKRRALIAAALEFGVELFCFLEGVKMGFVTWDEGPRGLAQQYGEWRDQPKYLNMRITAQAVASAGSATRGMYRGDVMGLNYASMALLAKHLWARPAVGSRHTERLIKFSQEDSATAVGGFQDRTGIRIDPPLSVVEGGKHMSKSLDARLIAAGCHSTRVRVLSTKRMDEMAPIVAEYEALANASSGNDAKEAAFDEICESWYLADEDDDSNAMNKLKVDLQKVARTIRS